MAAEQSQASNADAFDTYFRRADLDQDGRISGAEAVAFFQGSNLPKETLALVWSYAAGGNNYLGRLEFYNALRLVTVAQSGRQLTADLVKAALYGPAAAKIPAPKINLTSASAGQMNSVATSATQANQLLTQPTQSGFMRSPASQMNSMAVSAPQANNILPQSASTGFVRLPTSHMTAPPLPQSSQSGFMRPPTSQLNSMAPTSIQANSMMQQPPQAGFTRPSSQINSTVTLTPQANNMLLQPAQAGLMRPPSSLKTGLTGQQMPITTGLNYQGFPSMQNNFTRPPQASQVSASHPVQGFSQGLPASAALSPSLSTDWIASTNSGSQGAVNSQVLNHAPFADKDGFGTAQSNQEATSKLQIQHVISSPITSRPLDPVSTSFQTTSRDSNPLGVSGNGFSSNSIFGSDAFLAAQTNQDASIPISSTSSFSSSSNLAPVAPKNSVNPGQHANLHVVPGLPPAANQFQRNPSPIKQNQLEAMQNSSALPVHSVPSGSDSSASTQNEVPWPKISQSDIRKYTKVFLEVDKDRDGKISGVEARNLFLSWRLPREILKQVWDLSDQDNDSMLSMREFCVALYMMERYREGRPLPSVLPNSVKFDQTLILATGQPSSAYGAAWQPRPALSQQPIPESLSVVLPNRVESSTRTPIPSHLDDVVSPVQPKTRVPVLEQNMVNQLSEEEKKALNSKLEEATDADKKVQELEKEILDCKQKTENYRKQMQELVLYKSRCDSRLNEIIERVAADKREVELLAKKYEEKYKQTGDVASKLNVDQATFRDIQERKMELYSAIVKMDQGELSDGVLQERAEKIQTDLDELVNALNERCKDNGLRSKPTSLVELPFGWQPGIQEGVADWDENWDKFDKFDKDDGFTVIKELTLEVENVVAPEKLKSTLVTSVPAATTISNESDKVIKDGEPASFSNEEGKTDKSLTTGGLLTEAELSNVNGEDGSVRSPPGSSGRSTIESPSREFQSTFSPHAYAKEHHSEFDGPESTISGEKFTDEVTWGATFDSDDTDSLWGFNPIKTKESFHVGSRLDSFSGPGDFALNSPSADSVFGKDRGGPFFDSVPSTPLFNSGFSPRFNEGDDHNFDTFSRFDSFNMNDTIFPSNRTLTRFDSMNSTTDQSRDTFSRFDSFRSTADTQREFSRFDSMIGAAEPPRETLARFDSIRSTTDYNHGFSFDDSDPFGSGLFKTSESHTPKKNTTDQWSSF